MALFFSAQFPTAVSLCELCGMFTRPTHESGQAPLMLLLTVQSSDLDLWDGEFPSKRLLVKPGYVEYNYRGPAIWLTSFHPT